MSGEGAAQTSSSWWPKSKRSKELDEALDGEADFRQWLEQTLEESDLQALGSKHSAKDILNALDSQTYEKLTDVVEPYYASEKLAEAGRAQSHLRVKRTHGYRKVTTGFVKFAHAFQDFLKVYSGIVDIMKMASDQYGGIAYGTFSVLFSVAAGKQSMEIALREAIEELKTSLQEMEIYKRVYPEPNLGAIIAKVFKGITNFSRNATKYFKGEGRSRWKRATIKPDAFSSDVLEIKKHMTAVRSMCEALLAQRCERLENKSNEIKQKLAVVTEQNVKLQTTVDTLHEQNTELKGMVDTLRKQLSRQEVEVSGIRETEDSKHLTELLEQLGAPHYSVDSHRQDVVSYKKYLGMHVDNELRTRMDLAALRQKHEYSNWQDSEQSSILVLSGRTEYRYIENAAGCCWLSPTALELVDGLRDTGQVVIYHLCFVSPYQAKDPTPRDIMMSFICQVLTKFPKMLREPANFSRLRSEAPRNCNGEEEEFGDVLDFLIMVLNLVEYNGPIHLVLDRLDRSSKYEVEVLNALLRLVKEAGCILKVLVVVCADFWDINKNPKALETRKMGKATYHKLCLEQELQVF